MPIDPDGEGTGFYVSVLPKTGDETVIWPFVLFSLLALADLVVLIRGWKKLRIRLLRRIF